VRRRLVEVHDVEVAADIRLLCVLVCASHAKATAIFCGAKTSPQTTPSLGNYLIQKFESLLE
jgi:hypothetical protein